jgi:hypothetical protein
MTGSGTGLGFCQAVVPGSTIAVYACTQVRSNRLSPAYLMIQNPPLIRDLLVFWVGEPCMERRGGGLLLGMRQKPGRGLGKVVSG